MLCMLQVVKVRGEAMAAAASQGKPHGMLSVIGLNNEQLEPICSQARAGIGGDCVCRLANYLFPTGRVVSGHKDALAQVRAMLNRAVVSIQERILLGLWRLLSPDGHRP